MSSLIKTFKNNKEFHNPPLYPLYPLLKKVEQKITPIEEQNNPKINQNKLETFAPLFPKVDKVDSDIRFTKVLTKYSTEYNNSLFIQNLCQELGMDKKDLLSFFMELKNKYDDNQLLSLFENNEITKLDINRIYRYLEKYTKENAPSEDEKEIDEEDILDTNIEVEIEE
jgi:hypothetical protein